MQWFKHERHYYWEGINKHGEIQQDTIYARNKRGVKKYLATQHIALLSITRVKHTSRARKITARVLLTFWQQLYFLLKARLSLSDSLQRMQLTNTNIAVQQILVELCKKVQSGGKFHEALLMYPHYFPRLACTMVNMGEQTGYLPQAIELWISYYQQQLQIRQQIIKACTYPVLLLILTIFITLGLLIYVVPQFQTMYANFNVQLPLYTRVIIDSSQFLIKYWLVLLPSVISFGFLIYWIFKRIKPIQHFLDKMLFKLPGINNFARQLLLQRWASIVSMALQTKITLAQALQMAANSTKSFITLKQLMAASQHLEQGRQLKEAMQHVHFITPLALQLLDAGALTNQLDSSLQVLVAQSQSYLDTRIKQGIDLLEPLLMLLLAAIMGGIILAIYMPIVQMGRIV